MYGYCMIQYQLELSTTVVCEMTKKALDRLLNLDNININPHCN